MTPDCLKPRGLREEKKEQTRSALSDAALDLVSRHGYEAATVDAIARAAGVSVRTFHNYFPGKAAALAHLAEDLMLEYFDELRAQPDSLTCADALRDAWLAMLSRHRDNLVELLALVDAVESHPDLRRSLDEGPRTSDEQGIGEVARRLGVDPTHSVVPYVVVEITFRLTVTVIRMHESPEFSGRSYDRLLDEAFSALPLLVTTDLPTSDVPTTDSHS